MQPFDSPQRAPCLECSSAAPEGAAVPLRGRLTPTAGAVPANETNSLRCHRSPEEGDRRVRGGGRRSRTPVESAGKPTTPSPPHPACCSLPAGRVFNFVTFGKRGAGINVKDGIPDIKGSKRRLLPPKLPQVCGGGHPTGEAAGF